MGKRQASGHRRLDGASAASHVLSFVVAGAVFIAAIGGILFASRDAGKDAEPVMHANQEARAESLASYLVGSAGLGWEAGPDSIDRLGLLAANGSGLDAAHLEALRGAVSAAIADNGKVDYAEALASLGMADSDFHIRIYPIGLQPALLQADLAGIKTAYIGDWTSLASVTVALGSNESMKAEAQAKLDLQMASLTQKERDVLTSLGLGYKDDIYITTTTPTILVDIPLLPDIPLLIQLDLPLIDGDVYPDHKQYLDTVLASRLPQYELLIVGAGVDQSTLTSAVTKNAIRDFVLGGGTLFVFGSDKQNFQWLQPLFGVGVTTVNGAAFAPDVTHPVLHEPNALGWTGYGNHGKAWDIKDTGSGAHYDDFSHIVVAGTGDVLAISNEGAFGDGRIFLSTFWPKEISDVLGPDEAEALLMNFVLYADRSHLYLDYGAPVPGDVAVAAAVRESYLVDEKLGQVPVRIEVHYW